MKKKKTWTSAWLSILCIFLVSQMVYPLMKVNDNCVDMDFVLVTWSYFSPVVNTHDIFYTSNSY